MGLFDWGALTETEETCTDELQSTEVGKALLAIDRVTDCEKKLIPKDCIVPAAVLDEGNGPEYVDGSAFKPFRLGNLQEQEGGSFNSILFKKADGAFAAWRPLQDNCDYRLMVRNGLITVAQDETPNSIDNEEFDAVQDPASSNVEFLVGGKLVTGCDGKPKVRLLKVDKELLCTYCETISVV